MIRKLLVQVVSCMALVGALLVAGVSPAQADPELCTQHSYGKICIQRYPTTKYIRTTFYNNRGGANTLYINIVRYPSAIVKFGDLVTVPYGSSTSVGYTYTSTTATFQGYMRTADGTTIKTPWT